MKNLPQNSKGGFVSVTNFKFPEQKVNKLSIIYSSIRPSKDQSLSTISSLTNLTQTSFIGTLTSNSSSLLYKPSKFQKKPDTCINLRKKSRIASSVYINPQKKQDWKTFSVLTPEHSKREELLTINSIIKKPLHPNNLLKYYHSSIKNFISFDKFSSLQKIKKHENSRISRKLSYLDIKKIRMQTWIPQPQAVSSRRCSNK